MSFNTSNVICQELGYEYAIHHNDAHVFGSGSQSMLSKPIVCNGGESSINECEFISDICPHTRDVGVKCSHDCKLINCVSYQIIKCLVF